MGCKHELPQCRSGGSSRAVSAFAQFAVVINGAVRIFFYVWFKVTALKLLGQMCLMRRGSCRKPGLFGGGQPFPGAPSLWGITPKPCLAHGHRAVPFPAQQTSTFLWEIIAWHSIRATSSRLLIRGTQAQVFACCFKRLPSLPPPPYFPPSSFFSPALESVYSRFMCSWNEKKKECIPI